MKQEFTRIAVKVGSNVLTRRDGTLDVTRMSALVDQIAELHKSGVEIILISSGAVASGRSEIHPQKKLDSVDQRQLFSAVGQAKKAFVCAVNCARKCFFKAEGTKRRVLLKIVGDIGCLLLNGILQHIDGGFVSVQAPYLGQVVRALISHQHGGHRLNTDLVGARFRNPLPRPWPFGEMHSRNAPWLHSKSDRSG